MIRNSNISYQEFVNIVDNLYDEVLIYDNNYKIVYINKACERHYGISQSDMIGSSFFDYAKKIWSSSVLPYVYKTKRSVKQKQETRIGAKLLTIAIPIFDKNGDVEYVAMSVRDDIPANESQDVFILDKDKNTSNIKFDNTLITNNKKMIDLLSLANTIVDVDVPCLITGETGVGKTLISKYIHERSIRKNRPFVHINSAAINNDLIESELFGYTKGSFTGANSTGKKGLIQEAEGGILFLDEISEIPFELQAKLLQFIQEKKFYPIGSTKPISIDVKIMTATNKDLKKMVEIGTFREDLYYRLNVFEIQIPPLRERPEDILLFSEFYLNKYNQKYNRTHRFSNDVKNIFQNYSWQGNIRELVNIIERLCVVTKDIEIKPYHLPKHMYEIQENTSSYIKNIEFQESKSLSQMMENFEKQIILDAYSKYKSSRKVSQELEISQSKASRLYRKYTNNTES